MFDGRVFVSGGHDGLQIFNTRDGGGHLTTRPPDLHRPPDHQTTRPPSLVLCEPVLCAEPPLAVWPDEWCPDTRSQEQTSRERPEGDVHTHQFRSAVRLLSTSERNSSGLKSEKQGTSRCPGAGVALQRTTRAPPEDYMSLQRTTRDLHEDYRSPHSRADHAGQRCAACLQCRVISCSSSSSLYSAAESRPSSPACRSNGNSSSVLLSCRRDGLLSGGTNTSSVCWRPLISRRRPQRNDPEDGDRSPTFGVVHLEPDVQRDAAQAHGEAQPVEDAHAVSHHRGCQNQSAHLLRGRQTTRHEEEESNHTRPDEDLELVTHKHRKGGGKMTFQSSSNWIGAEHEPKTHHASRSLASCDRPGMKNNVFYLARSFNVTLKIPAMESVRLEVRDTSRNSEKQRPKASRPPAVSVSSVYRTGESSVARNSFSELLRLSPGNETDTMMLPLAG
ncbi:hypothetical protein EYF80_047387 [Liparis tanakae]|uniref:Uncharacterized protein n=1 Tax=Liparis tanakae TaxID=230148 RepID=A0A4Z2FNV1_9TELE|nr:hypothetical protein EYF80_047387 [Liparis tanakae]